MGCVHGLASCKLGRLSLQKHGYDLALMASSSKKILKDSRCSQRATKRLEHHRAHVPPGRALSRFLRTALLDRTSAIPSSGGSQAPTQQSGQSWARTSSPLPGLRPPVSWTQISPSANKTRHTCVSKCQRRVLGEADSAFRCPNADGVCRPLSSFCLTCAQGGAENRVLPPRCRWGRSDRQLLASPWPCWTPVTPEAPFFVGRAREARGSPDPGAVFRWSHLLDASRTAAARGRGRVGRGPGTGREAGERRGGRRRPPAPATCAPALGPLSCDSRPPSPRADSCRCPMTRCCRCEQGGEH